MSNVVPIRTEDEAKPKGDWPTPRTKADRERHERLDAFIAERPKSEDEDTAS